MRREQKGKESTKSTFRRANRAAAAPERVHGVPETALHYVCHHIVKRETRFEVCVFSKRFPRRVEDASYSRALNVVEEIFMGYAFWMKPLFLLRLIHFLLFMI